MSYDRRLSYELPFGRKDAIDRSENSPLYRALRKPLGKGAPGDRIVQTFLIDTTEDQAKWLGVFVYTKGKQLLFFPSTHKPFKLLDSSLASAAPIVIDHLTLENNHIGRHLTSPNSAKHVSAGKTTLHEGARHWFTLHMMNSVYMHPVARNLEFQFPVPQTDTDRRIELLYNTREGIVDHIVRTPEYKSQRNHNHTHTAFTVFVGSPGFPAINLVPSNNEFPFQILEDAVRIHRINIDTHTEIQVTCYCTNEYLKTESSIYF